MIGTSVHVMFFFSLILDFNAVVVSQSRTKCPKGYTLMMKHRRLKCVRKDCRPGYFGYSCQHKCRFPRFGNQCHFVCDCSRKLCDFAEGCPKPYHSCSDGYLGKYCETKCPYPSYGLYCQQECLCSKSKCNFSSGCQIYTNDSFRRFSTQPLLKFSTHDNNYKTLSAPKLRNSSTILKKSTGRHLCPDGFHGSNCETPCRYPNYGTYCQKKCHCSIKLCNASSGCSRSDQEENQSFATRRSTGSSAGTTDEKGIKMITGGKIYQKDITSVHAERKMEAQARNQVKEIPRENVEILWSIVVFAVLTVSLVIGHIYLTFSRRLHRRGVQSSQKMYSIACDE